VKQALEQMRQAAEQGQKEDAAGAAAKGEQAARQLRQAESQMQNGSPDARKRALGDLQLESQQVADAQRRIAAEAERLDREGGGAADARRRLAGEKDRLAERVDALQQAAERVGTQAAGDLAGQKLGERMRATAKGMRDGKEGRLAPAEQQIAEALDKVARKMNGTDAGGAKGDTQQLADQLNDVRDARERLARLERQIGEAKQSAENGRGRQDGRQAQPGRAGDPGRQGQQGARGAQGDGRGGDLQQLQQQYNQELQRTRELMDRLQRGNPESGGRMTTPEQHEWSRSAPGTEAFKQDYAAWQSLASDVTKALERAEASAANRLNSAAARDRLRAGGSDRVPDPYRARVSKYFESIAVIKK
jgi:colicin import membrane protein